MNARILRPNALPVPHVSPRWAAMLLCWLAVHLATPALRADTCSHTSSTPATNRLHSVNGLFAGQWNYVVTNLRTGSQQTRPLPDLDSHAHLQFFLSEDSKRFAVLDASADHHLTNRFMIYTLSGKRIASLGLKDILTPDEQSQVQHSISHIWWLNSDPVYVAKHNAVCLITRSGRAVLISLADGKVSTLNAASPSSDSKTVPPRE